MEQHSKLFADDSDKQVYLVTGATGTVGKQVVFALLRAGYRVRALTRKPSEANFPDSVEVVADDLESQNSFKEVLENVMGLHLITFTGSEYRPLQTGSEIIEMAKDAGVKRITVLWSGEGKKSPVEQAVESSNLDWTILQPQEFMANALAWKKSIIEEGVVKEPFAARPTAVIHEEDIGAVAAAILTLGGHTSKTYTLTGPEILTPLKQVAIISESINKNLEFLELSEAEAIHRWKQDGYADELIQYLVQWYRNPPKEAYTISPIVEQITGKPAKSFSQWALEQTQTFIS